MIFLALLLAASVSHLTLTDETVTLGPNEVRGLDLTLQQREAVIVAGYEVLRGSDGISAFLIGPGDAGSSAPGQPNQYLRLAPDRKLGSFRFPAAVPGDYQIVLDNRGEDSVETEVRLSVSLVFGEAGTLRPGAASNARRSVVIGVSVFFFLLVGLYSSQRLFRAIRRRPRRAPLPPF